MQVPDALEPLPVLKAVIAAEMVDDIVDPNGDQVRPKLWTIGDLAAGKHARLTKGEIETERFRREISYRVHSPLISDCRWDQGPVDASCHSYGRHLQHKPEPVVPHRPPHPDCSCGIYGWYPWAQTRWPGYTPMSAGVLHGVDPRPHPLLGELTTWAGYRLVTGNQPWEATMWNVQYSVMCIGVVEVEGEVSVCTDGVKAQRARLAAIVDPESIPFPPVSTWRHILSAKPDGIVDRNASLRQDKLAETLAFHTHLLGRAWDGPLVRYGDAVSLMTEAWGDRGRRLRRLGTIV